MSARPRRHAVLVSAAIVAVVAMAAPGVASNPHPGRPDLRRAAPANRVTRAPAAPTRRATFPGRVVSNGSVVLGVNRTGDLNYDCAGAGDPACPPASVEGVTVVGLRYAALNTEGTADGCLCEGWGAGDAGSGLTGYANEAAGVSSTLAVSSFSGDGSTTAVSTVAITDASRPGFAMRVEQDYHPSSATPSLYEDTVTISNTGTKALSDVRYRRVMDWDVEPTAFSEWVTVQGARLSDSLAYNSDDGFDTADPLSPPASPTGLDAGTVCAYGSVKTCDYVDLGLDGTYPNVTTPDDHGSLFDFRFGALAVGASVTFHVFYGATGNETAALDAVGKAGAELYSLGESNCPSSNSGGTATDCSQEPANAGVTKGTPTTFIFAFSGVGGIGVETCQPPTLDGTAGNDKMHGTTGADKVEGEAGKDVVDGLAGNDELCGDDGSDTLYGRTGNDNLQGGNGNDRLYGGAGDDIINGGPGNDAIFAGSGANTILANDGEKDCIVTFSASDSVSVDPIDLVNPPAGCPPGFWNASSSGR